MGYTYLDGLMAELDGWTVASFQQRGLPPSTLDGPFDVATGVADIAAVLDRLDWGQDTYLLGHSWGGPLALQAACRLTGGLAGVLSVDPMGIVGDGGEPEFEAEIDRRLSPAARTRVEEIGETEDDELADEQLELLWPAYFASPATAPPYASVPLSQQAFHGLMQDQGEQRSRLEAALPSLAVPLGVVMGAGSPMPRRAGADVVDLVPGAWLDVIPNAGHLIWLEAPGAVRRALDRLADGDRQ
jgi:pimeloyl-ACP methyl ester carboxylesterase